MDYIIPIRRILVLIFLITMQSSAFSDSCSFARDPKACLTKCTLKEDDVCRADWLDRDAETRGKLLEAARVSNEDFQTICSKRLVQPKICDYCRQKTRECALEALELERDEVVKHANLLHEINRMSELTKNPTYTNDSLKKFDPRKPIDRRLYRKYNPIGIVQSSFGRSTGWLTTDCLVVTARHAITGSDLEEKDKSPIGRRVKFLVGFPQTEDMNFTYKSEGTVVAAGENGRKIFQDWAVIRLDQSLGKDIGKIETWQYSVEDAQTCVSLEIAGYPGGKNIDRLWGQTHCPLEKYLSSKYQFILGCPATEGNSGGPLLCRETDGDLRAIGIVATQSYGAMAQALNFTADWFENIKPALQKYANSCPQGK